MKTRPLKPHFWDDEIVAPMSPVARLTYECCWNLSDDAGNLPGNPRLLYNKAFGYDLTTTYEDVVKALQALERKERLVPYQVKGQRYYHGPTFQDQFNVPKNRRFVKFPAFTKRGKSNTYKDKALFEHDTDTAETMQLHCGSGSGSGSGVGFGLVPDGTLSTSPEPKIDPSILQDIFRFWVATMNKRGTTIFTADRKSKVRARLNDGYSVEDIQKAITGCACSPYHMGDNQDGKHYNDLSLICRDGTHLERFRDYADDPPKPKASESTSYPKKGEGWTL